MAYFSNGGKAECPVCKSENVEQIDSYAEDDYYLYKMKCNTCGLEYTDYHKMVYSFSEAGINS